MALPCIYDMFNKAWEDYQTIYIVLEKEKTQKELSIILKN